MFVIPRSALPKDPVFPADMEKLGYFVTKDDQIRMISDPSQPFKYKINRHERYRELQKEAMNICVRELVLQRLHDLGLQTLRLPLGADEKSAHVPILVSPDLQKKSRVIVVFGEPNQDLAIWSYRTLGTETVNKGSAVDFVKGILATKHTLPNGETETPGVILANCGQLTWWCRGEKAISLATWSCLPKESLVDPPPIATHRNTIPGNGDWSEHIEYIFDNVLAKMVSPKAKIDIVGIEEGSKGAVEYLSDNWDTWQSRISAMCFINPLHDISNLYPPEYETFVNSRCRAYGLSAEPIDLPMPGRLMRGCNCYASSEEINAECVMPAAQEHVLKFLNTMADDPDLVETDNKVPENVFVDDEDPWAESSA